MAQSNRQLRRHPIPSFFPILYPSKRRVQDCKQKKACTSPKRVVRRKRIL